MSTKLPTHKERMEALSAAHAEMNEIIAKGRITSALTRDIAPVADTVYKSVEEISVYSEKKWIGP